MALDTKHEGEPGIETSLLLSMQVREFHDWLNGILIRPGFRTIDTVDGALTVWLDYTGLYSRDSPGWPLFYDRTQPPPPLRPASGTIFIMGVCLGDGEMLVTNDSMLRQALRPRSINVMTFNIQPINSNTNLDVYVILHSSAFVPYYHRLKGAMEIRGMLLRDVPLEVDQPIEGQATTGLTDEELGKRLGEPQSIRELIQKYYDEGLPDIQIARLCLISPRVLGRHKKEMGLRPLFVRGETLKARARKNAHPPI